MRLHDFITIIKLCLTIKQISIYVIFLFLPMIDHYVLETYFMLKQVLKADNKSPVATGGPAPPIASRKSYYKMIQCSRNIVNQS